MIIIHDLKSYLQVKKLDAIIYRKNNYKTKEKKHSRKLRHRSSFNFLQKGEVVYILKVKAYSSKPEKNNVSQSVLNF